MTTDKCFSCERKDESLLCGICGIGINGEREYYTRKPITNADRIRSMTDEEMANEFSGQCPAVFGGTRMSGEDCAGFESCQDCWLDWLKQKEE